MDGEQGPGSQSSRVPLGVQFNANKAGLDKGNLERISRVVHEAARGGRFYENEQRKEKELASHVSSLRARAARAQPVSRAASSAVTRIEGYRGACDRTYVCVDFDAFYAAVEALDNPTLVGKPHAVGGGRNSVLSTSSYEARKFGVRSAMPLYIAKRLCPELIVVPGRPQRYAELSGITRREVFEKYDASVEMRSLDEAILDITEFCRTSPGTVADVIEALRADVTRVTGGLTVSCGVACTRTLAKICADKNKPNGAYHLPADREAIVSFCSELPIRKVPGIGKVTERLLSDGLDIFKLRDVLEPAKLSALHHIMQERTFNFLVASALGVSMSKDIAEPGGMRKSVSRERTFQAESDSDHLRETCRDLCDRIEMDFARLDGIDGGRCISIKVKTSDFRVRSRSKTVTNPVRDAKAMREVALQMLEAELPLSVRLLGVRVSALVGSAVDADEIERSRERDQSQRRIDSFFRPGNTEQDLLAQAQEESEADVSTIKVGDEHAAGGTLCEKDEYSWDTDSWIPPCPSSQPMQPSRRDPVSPRVPKRQRTGMGYECPVCCVAHFHDLVLLNKHVDKCLVRASQASPKPARGPAGGAPSRARRRQADMDCFVLKTGGKASVPNRSP